MKISFNAWELLGAKSGADALKQTLGIDVTDAQAVIKATTGVKVEIKQEKEAKKAGKK